MAAAVEPIEVHDDAAATLRSVAGNASRIHGEQGRSIGAFLIDAGKLSPESAEQVLRLQKMENLRFGEAAISA